MSKTKHVLPALIILFVWTAAGTLLQWSELVTHPAYWALYGVAWGVGLMVLLIKLKSPR